MDRRLSVPLALPRPVSTKVSTGSRPSAAAFLLSTHNGARAGKDEQLRRTPPMGSENWDPSTPGASSRTAHARSFSASALTVTPIKWIVHGLGLSGPKQTEVEDEQEAEMDVKPEGDVALDAVRSPASPSFNAAEAHARCCEKDGYISFSEIEGLGDPPASPDHRKAR
ncbi:hypothetical protein B0H11DRAFT_570083 [Mycena galericulata]|nr:hypothetical protein B0H11DRAFT_570083 [Mycena galericulata]